MANTSATSPLLGDTVNDSVDYRGNPVTRSKTGRWSSSIFILGAEIAERIAYYGVSSNLITYLTGPMQQSTARAAQNVNIWSGVATMLPLFGAFIADYYLGRYKTIAVGSLIYILGLGMLTLSVVLPSHHPSECINNTGTVTCSSSSSPSQFKVFFFFCSLYLVALGEGMHKPCISAFGADQFDQQDPEERKSISSFFNWWNFGLSGGITVSIAVMSYIQDNQGWALGFGVPWISMVVSLVVFLHGTKLYRCKLPHEEKPFKKFPKFFVAVKQKGSVSSSTTNEAINQKEFRAVGVSDHSNHPFPLNDGRNCIANEAEQTKGSLQLFSMCATCVVFAIVLVQSVTLFTKQGTTMNRKIGLSFQIPAAALQSFTNVSMLVLIPIYDCVLVPITKKFTGISSGITMLQRIGIGMFLFVISMAVAALVEMKRLRTARDFGLIDFPTETIPMSIWWLVSQYLLFGVANVFMMVGSMEFCYDQMPRRLKSLGIAMFLGIFGVGNFLSGFLIALIQKISGGSWFCDNLNQAHLDYFYWLLCGLSIVALALYLLISKSYVYRRND